MIRKAWMFVVLALLLTAVVPLVGVSAQSADRSITITEAQINDSYAVQYPLRRGVTNVVVDLQPGQVVVNYDWTPRARRGQTQQTYAISSTWTAAVTNGRIYWTLASATVDGAPASPDWINQINAHIASSWRNFLRGEAGPGRFTGITISDNDLTVTWTPAS